MTKHNTCDYCQSRPATWTVFYPLRGRVGRHGVSCEARVYSCGMHLHVTLQRLAAPYATIVATRAELQHDDVNVCLP